jgi:hypothetical protein
LCADCIQGWRCALVAIAVQIPSGIQSPLSGVCVCVCVCVCVLRVSFRAAEPWTVPHRLGRVRSALGKNLQLPVACRCRSGRFVARHAGVARTALASDVSDGMPEFLDISRHASSIILPLCVSGFARMHRSRASWNLGCGCWSYYACDQCSDSPNPIEVGPDADSTTLPWLYGSPGHPEGDICKPCFTVWKQSGRALERPSVFTSAYFQRSL